LAKISELELNIIRNEIKICEKNLDDFVIPQMETALAHYLGGPFNSTYLSDVQWDVYLNEVYSLIQYELPSIFFQTPRVFLKPRNKTFIAKKFNPRTQKKEDTFLDADKSAKTQEHILNYSLHQMDYKRQNRRTLMNALLFKYGVMWHGYKADFGMTDEESFFIENEQIFVENLSPKDFLFDPKVSIENLPKAKWVGRKMEVLLRDLDEDPDIDLDPSVKGKEGFGEPFDALRPKASGSDTRSPSTRGTIDSLDDEFKKSARFVTVYEIFRRPSKKERLKGEKGQVLLLTDEQKKPLRKPNPWPYKAKGFPVQILMFNETPETMFGLSDIEVYGPIANHKNLIFNLQIRNAEANSKNMVGYDKTEMDEETIEKIENGEQNIIGFNGDPKTKIAIASPGGQASNELYLIDGRIQANLDEKSGVTDLKKGFLKSGEESATSVQIRNAGSSARPAYRRDIMADFLKKSFKFLNDLNQQYMPIKEAVRVVGSLDIEWSDNPTKEEIQADVDIELDVISMLPENPEKEIEELNAVLALMINAINDPAVRQKITEEGKTFNLSPIIENLLMRLKIRNPDVFRNISEEESQGFASVAELKAAQANVEATLLGQPVPSPPEEGQDHGARLGVYEAATRLGQLEGKVNQALQELAFVQQELANIEAEKESPKPGQPLKPSAVTGFGE
jgi:hypothetical protein